MSLKKLSTSQYKIHPQPYISKKSLEKPKSDKPKLDLSKYFHDAIDKFKLYSIFTSEQKKLALSKIPNYIALHKQFTDEGEDKDKVEEKKKDFNSLTLLRRLTRIFYHISLVVIVSI